MTDLRGRRFELEALRGLLASIREGPAALLVSGAEGSGKSAFLDEGRRLARMEGHRLMSSRPSPVERRLSFGVVADLLAEGADDVRDELPPPLRTALDAAILFREPPPNPAPDRRAIFMAVLAVVRASAQAGPIVIAIDDAQWIDAASRAAIAYAVRRLDAEPIGLLLAHEPESAAAAAAGGLVLGLPPERIARIELGPLDAEAIDGLIAARLGLRLGRSSLTRLHRAAGGNPGLALELAGALVGREDPVRTADALPVPSTFRRMFRERLRDMPDECAEVLLCISAAREVSAGRIREVLGSERADRGLARAVDGGLAEPDGASIRLRHPALGLMVHEHVDPERAREIFGALARTVPASGGTSAAVERASLLARAAAGPDETVANELERAAAAEAGRGAPESAAELLEQARDLTPRDGRASRIRRAVAAADRRFEAGEAEPARTLLEEALGEAEPGAERADILRRMGWLSYHHRSYGDAVALLTRAQQEAGHESAARILIERDLAWAAVMFGDVRSAAEHARAALEMSDEGLDPAGTAETLTAVGLADAILGHGLRRDVLARTIELDERGAEGGEGRRASRTFGVLLKWGDDLDAARARYQELAERAGGRGDDGSLPLIHLHLADIELRAGSWAASAEHAERGHEAAVRTGQEPARALLLATKALVGAHLGREGSLGEAEEAAALAARIGVPSARVRARHATGFHRLALGDPAGAEAVLGPLLEEMDALDLFDPDTIRVVPDAVEALALLGEADRASELADVLQSRMGAVSPVWAEAVAGRCRGLIEAARGRLDRSVSELEHAVEVHRRLGQPFELGRTLLVAGIVNRRVRRKREAKARLEEALATFESLGALLWAEQARREASRLGIRTSPPGVLSPTEQRVAELVASGLTNREVAAALFIAEGTVEVNLKKVYRKLGVRSRTELTRRILLESREASSGEPSGDRTRRA